MERSHLSSLFALVVGLPLLFGASVLALLASWPAYLTGFFSCMLLTVVVVAALDILNLGGDED